jgi:hypothetical protein
VFVDGLRVRSQAGLNETKKASSAPRKAAADKIKPKAAPKR